MLKKQKQGVAESVADRDITIGRSLIEKALKDNTLALKGAMTEMKSLRTEVQTLNQSINNLPERLGAI